MMRVPTLSFRSSSRGLLTAILLAALLPGCGAREAVPALDPQAIARDGTAELSAPRPTVFRACVIALGMSGFAVDAAEPETGIIVTRPKEEALEREGAARFRAYVVEVKDGPEGRVLVTLTPALSTPGGPTGRLPVSTWDLADEREAWARLFGDVRLVLQRQARKGD